MTKPEYERARDWREHMDLSRGELSVLTGWSVESITNFERGERRGDGGAIGEQAWLRYKLCCAAVNAARKFNQRFDWGH